MNILITTKTVETPGPDVTINCPSCDRQGVVAHTYERHERLGLFSIVPLFGVRNTFVKCSACGGELLATIPLGELDTYQPDQLDQVLVRRASFILKFCAVAGLLLFWAPVVGLALASIGLLGTFRSGGWPLKVSIVGTVLGAVVTVAFWMVV